MTFMHCPAQDEYSSKSSSSQALPTVQPQEDSFQTPKPAAKRSSRLSLPWSCSITAMKTPQLHRICLFSLIHKAGGEKSPNESNRLDTEFFAQLSPEGSQSWLQFKFLSVSRHPNSLAGVSVQITNRTGQSWEQTQKCQKNLSRSLLQPLSQSKTITSAEITI